jgi:hypothetical protein
VFYLLTLEVLAVNFVIQICLDSSSAINCVYRYVPNELRGGMISLSLTPANAAILLFLIQGGYYRNIGNSTILAVAALGLLTAAGSMHVLKRLGKQPYQNWHKS